MGYHHALKSTETISKAVQRFPIHLRHSIYKYTQINVDPNKSLSLLQFEKLVRDNSASVLQPNSKYCSQSRVLQV